MQVQIEIPQRIYLGFIQAGVNTVIQTKQLQQDH